MLPTRGILHSHGYLTTLRGVLDLYEYDRNKEHFKYVINAYNELILSEDYTIYGSVREYFGNRGNRDEGCSTADFIRLSLRLYKLTKDVSYLERAEFGLYNALYFNQFFTGDFGHHTFDNTSSYSNIFNAAWWCCTMSGLRAMQIIQNDYFLENTGGQLRINLYIDTEYTDENVSLSLKKGRMDNEFHSFDIMIGRFDEIKQPFLLRKPSWISDAQIFLNNVKIECKLDNGYYSVEEKLSEGDILQIKMKYLTKIIMSDKSSIPVDEIQQPVSGALCYGPYIMAVDNNLDYTFLSEPNNNVVYCHTLESAASNMALENITRASFIGDSYLVASYKHGGFPSFYQTVFRPVSEMTFNRHPYMMVLMKFVPESLDNGKFVDKTMVDPWMEH